MGCYVYMLRCADGSFYVGSATGDDLILAAESLSIKPAPTLAIPRNAGR
jgi:hypothetical protein